MGVGLVDSRLLVVCGELLLSGLDGLEYFELPLAGLDGLGYFELPLAGLDALEDFELLLAGLDALDFSGEPDLSLPDCFFVLCELLLSDLEELDDFELFSGGLGLSLSESFFAEASAFAVLSLSESFFAEASAFSVLDAFFISSLFWFIVALLLIPGGLGLSSASGALGLSSASVALDSEPGAAEAMAEENIVNKAKNFIRLMCLQRIRFKNSKFVA